MNCPTCKMEMRQLVPCGDEYQQETVQAMASVEWCPACGTVTYNFDDDEGGCVFNTLVPAKTKETKP